MVDEMTWKACMSSEIFREYLDGELRKDAELERTKHIRAFEDLERKVSEDESVWAQFNEFQQKVSTDSELLNKLKLAKTAILEHPELVEKVDKNFLHGLSLLDLGDTDDD